MNHLRLLFLVTTSAPEGDGTPIRETWAKTLPKADDLIFVGAHSGLTLLDGLTRALALPHWDFLIQLDDRSYAMPERLRAILDEFPRNQPVHAQTDYSDCQAFNRPALVCAFPSLSNLCSMGGLTGPAAIPMAMRAARIGRSELPPFFYRNRRSDSILRGAGAVVQDMSTEDLRALHALVCAAPPRPFEAVAASLGYGDLGLDGLLGYDSSTAIVNGMRRYQAISAHAPSLVVLRAAPGLLLEFAGAINDSSPLYCDAEAAFRIASREGQMFFDLGAARREHQTPWISLRVPADGRVCLHADTESRDFCHSIWLWRAPDWQRENQAAEHVATLLADGAHDSEIAAHLNQTEPHGTNAWNAQVVRQLRWRHGLRVPFETDAHTVLQLYQMMKDVHELFCHGKIDYWADSGTLLGAVRHQGLIPWDDDLDICIPVDQQKELVALEPLLHKLGYRLVKWWGGWKAFPETGRSYDRPFPWKFPFVDIFLMSRKGHRFVYTTDPGIRRNGEPFFIDASELFPLADYQFGAFSIRGPRCASEILESLYGAGWNNVGAKDYHHDKESYCDPISIELTAQDRHAAQPTGPLLDQVGPTLIPPPEEVENPLNRDVFLPLLKRWIELTTEHGIPYSIYWGTLLGQARNQRIIPYDADLDVVVGRTGAEVLYGLPRRAPGCVYNDELKNQPLWRDGEIRLVVKKDLLSADAPRYAHDGRRVPTQVDSCAFSAPFARLVIRKVGLPGTEFRHLDVDLFTDLSRFKEYPRFDEADELPELEHRSLENLVVSCLKDPLPYLLRFYGDSYFIPDRVYQDGQWPLRSPVQVERSACEAAPEPFQVVEGSVGWGRIGLGGALGYEGRAVVVAGVQQQQALSAHAPSRVLLHARSGLLLEFTGALNDSSPVRVRAQADFSICTRSGEVLVDLGTARAQHPTSPAKVHVPADGLLLLLASTESPTACHSVWLWRIHKEIEHA